MQQTVHHTGITVTIAETAVSGEAGRRRRRAAAPPGRARCFVWVGIVDACRSRYAWDALATSHNVGCRGGETPADHAIIRGGGEAHSRGRGDASAGN